MRNLGFAIVLALAMAGCSKGDAYEVPTGSDVKVQKRDGVVVSGKLVEVKSDQVVLEANGQRTPIRRSEITSLAAAPPEPSPTTEGAATGEPAATSAPRPEDASGREAPAAVPSYREVTLPAGTVLPVELKSGVASDTSQPEDEVRATLRRAVAIGGVQVLPAGTAVVGHVTDATRSARVKGRATIAFRFNRIDLPGDGGRYNIRSATVSRVAPATKKQDAAKIGGGAAGGAIIGGILGGGDGAAKGAVIGGAAGTGVVLSTRGKEVRLGPGASLSVKLTEPLTVRVRS